MNASEAKKLRKEVLDAEYEKEMKIEKKERKELNALASATVRELRESVPKKIKDAARKGGVYCSAKVPYSVAHHKYISDYQKELEKAGYQIRVVTSIDNDPSSPWRGLETSYFNIIWE